MAKKQFNAEQIVAKLRQIDVLLGSGKPLAQLWATPMATSGRPWPWRTADSGGE
jgi:hypothetical protein